MFSGRFAHSIGVDLGRIAIGLRALPAFLKDRRAYLNQHKDVGLQGTFALGPSFPCLHDRRETAGVASGHYFHQDLHMAQLIHAADPPVHVDVGSRIDGFVAHIAAFCTVEVLDIRQADSSALNIRFLQRDIMKAL